MAKFIQASQMAEGTRRPKSHLEGKQINKTSVHNLNYSANTRIAHNIPGVYRLYQLFLRPLCLRV